MQKNISNFKKKSNKSENFFLSIIYGIVFCIAMMVIISILSSALSLKFKNPINLSQIMSAVCVITGGIACGLGASSTYKSNPLLSSCLSSAIVSIVLLTINYTSFNSSVVNIILLPSVLFICAVSTCMIYSSTFKRKKMKKYLK